MALLIHWMWQAAPSALSFLGNSAAAEALVYTVVSIMALLALTALVLALAGVRDPFCLRLKVWTGRFVWLVGILFLLVLVDRPLCYVIHTFREAIAATKNPQAFLPSMFYMLYNGRSMFGYGIKTTVILALEGTAIAFVLSLLLVFLRIQQPSRQDSDTIRILKALGRWFANLYITVIRGTPMMVQALIIYYAGFGLFKMTDMTVTEINSIWSYFISGLITVSLNSTAYLAEVLRGGIESIDAGQNEAARSLGMTNWQAMCRIIFPQAIKNSLPAIGNEFIINIKDSSVLSVIGCYDLMYATTSVVGIYYKALPVYCIAAVAYLILTYLSSLLIRYLSKKLDTAAVSLPSSN